MTLVTDGRLHYLGRVENQRLIASQIGAIAKAFWYEIPKYSKFVRLGAFTLMPNHLHGIINIIGQNNLLVFRQKEAPNPETSTNYFGDISPKSGSLGQILRSYKSAVTREVRRNGWAFGWQPGYHDQVIRQGTHYQSIENYIKTNPLRWKEDGYRTSRLPNDGRDDAE